MEKQTRKQSNEYRIWGSHNGGYEEIYLLGYNAVQPVKSQPKFRKNVSPPSSGCVMHATYVTLIFFLAYTSSLKMETDVGWLSTDYTAL
jgi:hypothetical protein